MPTPSKSLLTWSGDTSIKWRWLERDEYSSGSGGATWGILIEARDGCPNDLYAEIQIFDKDDFAIGWTNDTTGSLRPGQQAKLVFDTFEEGARSARPNEFNCY